MADKKKKPIPKVEKFIKELWTDIREFYGEEPRRLRHMVEKTAADQRHLAMIDAALDDADFTTLQFGSMGQAKTEINPLVSQRDKVSRTVTDDLEALQLTQRSAFKKKENNEGSNDGPMAEFYNH